MTPRRVPRVCGVVEVLLGWYFLAISVDPGFTPKGLANPVVIGPFKTEADCTAYQTGMRETLNADVFPGLPHVRTWKCWDGGSR